MSHIAPSFRKASLWIPVVLAIASLSPRARATEPVLVRIVPQAEVVEQKRLAGEGDAKNDVAKGTLIVRSCGDLAPPKVFYPKFNVLELTNPCYGDDEAQAYNDGYNAVVNAELKRRYGKDFMQLRQAGESGGNQENSHKPLQPSGAKNPPKDGSG